jgi:hypothetical protein
MLRVSLRYSDRVQQGRSLYDRGALFSKMTLASWVLRWIRRQCKRGYCGATMPATILAPDPALGGNHRAYYGIEDMMLRLYAKPEEVRTVRQLKHWLADHARSVMRDPRGLPLRKFIMCFDRWTPAVKAMVCHVERDVGVEPLDAAVMHIDDAYPDSAIPNNKDWLRFLKTRDAVKRQLYPVIYNAFIDPDYFKPLPGELLILHGLPGRVEFQPIPMWDRGPLGASTVQVLLPCPCPTTPQMEQAAPDLFQHVWLIEGREGGAIHKEEWVAAKNNIGEADLAIAFYDAWFCEENCIVLYPC